MAKVFDEITDHIRDWVSRQTMFFVGTAPLTADGHVNLSPKGPIRSLRILGPHRIAYLDVTGSGSETIAHLRENGRIVVMLCAFEGPPRIVRFHGTGRVILPEDPEFAELLEAHALADASLPPARRSIVDVDVQRISDSCGYGVPLMSFEGLRDHHSLSVAKHIRTKGEDGFHERRYTNNAQSLDGLPALDRPD